VHGVNIVYMTEENGVANGYGPPSAEELPALDLASGEVTGPPPAAEAQPEFIQDPPSDIGSQVESESGSVGV
jgi:hypothetical protein